MQKVWKRALALGFAAALVLGAGLAFAGCDEEGDPNENGNGGQTDAVGGQTDAVGGQTDAVGVQVTEAEWSALLDSVATAEEDGIYLLGQNNFKFEVKEYETANSIDLAWTVISAGDSVQVDLEGSYWSLLRYSDCYLQVNGEDSITVYTYDEEEQTWSKETMAFSTSNYLFMFLSLSSPVEGGMKMSEMMPYSDFTFDEESGTYTGTIDSTVPLSYGSSSDEEIEAAAEDLDRAVAMTSSGSTVEYNFNFDGTASIRFGNGNVQELVIDVVISYSYMNYTVDCEYAFTAGGQSVAIPAEALAAAESA